MTEFVTADDGVKIAYEQMGAGKPVLLVHGFGSSSSQNWKSTGWYGSLGEAGYAAVALDCRGHGMSDKPHEEKFYGHARMAADVKCVMTAAGIESAILIGYSMGGFIGLRCAAMFPDAILKLALGGVGEYYLRGPRISSEGQRNLIADALLTDDVAGITDPRARMFRAFADQPGKDRFALAACMRAMSPPLEPAQLQALTLPVLAVCGDKDDIAGDPARLAAMFPAGAAVTVPERDHMSAVGDCRTRQAVLDFMEL